MSNPTPVDEQIARLAVPLVFPDGYRAQMGAPCTVVRRQSSGLGKFLWLVRFEDERLQLVREDEIVRDESI